MAVAYLFPGQGSQSAGMGEELFDDYPELLATADGILGYSVRKLCLASDGRLRRTEYAQPALFVVNAMAYLRRRRRGEPDPAFLAGHSLGEYSALFAAGCLDFETALRLVRRRGELMAGCASGAMMAVLGVPPERLSPLLSRAGVDGAVDVANHNTPEQLVLAGPEHDLRRLQDLLTATKTGKGVPLNVSVAAHSRYMAPAAEAFAEELGAVTLAEPRIPVIANATAEPYTVATAARLLTRHLTSPVRWWETLCLLTQHGVDRIEEIGPGQVLSRMWDKAQPHLPARAPAPASGPVAAPAAAGGGPGPERLGSAGFREAYGVRLAYLVGGMGYGVSGPPLLRRLADAGLLGFLGTAGRLLSDVEDDLAELSTMLGRCGVSLPVGVADPGYVRSLVGRAVAHGIQHAEAPGHAGVTPELVGWRFGGEAPGEGRRLLVKVARAGQAAAFLRPPPPELVSQLAAAGELTPDGVAAATRLPVATALCAEAESGWLAGGGAGSTLLPAVLAARDEATTRHRYRDPVWAGASGGIGDPVAVAAAFLAGADFVLTGSVNQCSPQADTSAAVKQLLATVDIDDTGHAPAGELFELGGRTRVVSRRGTLFAARATSLYQTYGSRGDLAELDRSTRQRLETDYFGRSLPQVWAEVREHAPAAARERAERDPRYRMALVFRSYFAKATRAALRGDPGDRLNYQIPCGPAMGALNRAVSQTALADWRSRHVDLIAEHLMAGAADLLARRLRTLVSPPPARRPRPAMAEPADGLLTSEQATARPVTNLNA